ncbi:MAG: YjdF family protein [Clostridiaceae bacterium]
MSRIKLSLYYDGQFWVGFFERILKSELTVCKVVFGSEPNDMEVYDFINKNFYSLGFSLPQKLENFEEKKINPKRLQRKIKNEVQQIGVGTKSQLALKSSMEQLKTEKKVSLKEKKQQEKDLKFLLKQEKKKEKNVVIKLL